MQLHSAQYSEVFFINFFVNILTTFLVQFINVILLTKNNIQLYTSNEYFMELIPILPQKSKNCLQILRFPQALTACKLWGIFFISDCYI